MGRPRKYFSEEERKQANRLIKSKYMLNKEWLCPACDYRDYSLAGKWTHLKTKKHIKNAEAKNILNFEDYYKITYEDIHHLRNLNAL